MKKRKNRGRKMAKDKHLTKTTIFIDWSNIFVPAKKNFSTKVSPDKLRQLLIDKFKDNSIIQTHLFSSKDSKNKGQENFFITVRKSGIIVHTEELIQRSAKIYCKECDTEIENPICPSCGKQISLPPHKSKKIDIKLATVMLNISDTYEEAILVSGDQDFHKAICRIKDLGKRIEIAYFDSNDEDKPALCGKMKRIADRFIDLGKIAKKIKR